MDAICVVHAARRFSIFASVKPFLRGGNPVDIQERRIAALLLKIDCDAQIPWDGKIDEFARQITAEDRNHPLARWILRISPSLDWRDNVREFLVGFWGLPPQGFLAGEVAVTEYESAARARLAKERAAVDE